MIHRSMRAVALAAIAGAIIAPNAAAAPSARAEVDDGTLRISGSPLAENIALRVSALDRNQLQVDFGDNGSADRTFDLSTFRAIQVSVL